jgi:hypothetical protein
VHTLLRQSAGETQVWDVAHLVEQGPPQSMSDSVEFLTVSVQVGVWHFPLRHTLLSQSVLVPQVAPGTHFRQPPPQSTSVSPWFFTLSVHEGTWHVLGLPEQTPLTQSLAERHALGARHLAHEPPQSMSVSSPFFWLSLQVEPWQKRSVHTA